MSENQGAGCTRPAAGAAITVEESQPRVAAAPATVTQEQKMIHVGEKAPDFVAPAYHKGAFVDQIKLSDYAGKWVLLCFYPGDFTFV